MGLTNWATRPSLEVFCLWGLAILVAIGNQTSHMAARGFKGMGLRSWRKWASKAGGSHSTLVTWPQELCGSVSSISVHWGKDPPRFRGRRNRPHILTETRKIWKKLWNFETLLWLFLENTIASGLYLQTPKPGWRYDSVLVALSEQWAKWGGQWF